MEEVLNVKALVASAAAMPAKAKAVGASVVTEPYSVAGRRAAMVQFPGGYIAEIHSAADK